VGSPHVRVGHCQALKPESPKYKSTWGFFYAVEKLYHAASLYFVLSFSNRRDF